MLHSPLLPTNSPCGHLRQKEWHRHQVRHEVERTQEVAGQANEQDSRNEGAGGATGFKQEKNREKQPIRP
jgi:hypothetical protein